MSSVAPAIEAAKQSAAPRALLYPATIFAGAFLLFAVQPAVARVILPWFGGSAAVWSACMLFFQMVLLGGYVYSYWSVRYLSPRAQALVHVSLLLVCLLQLPIAPNPAWKPGGAEDPTLRILALLAANIGLPYFLLSTTGPLLQAWYARAHEGTIPYRLFAVSNAASMLALLSYPVLVEPMLGSQQQLRWWSGAYVIFALLAGLAASRALRATRAAPTTCMSDTTAPAPRWSTQLLWIALAACASSMLLAVTNHLCKNVAPIPFLWVLPLALYLVSFILCFEGRGWYRRDIYTNLLLVAFAAMAYGISKYGETGRLGTVIAIFCAGLFVCCMACHGELAQLKPHPRYLTSFYLMVALGGALGGVFVGVVAPYLFRAAYELPISIVASMFLPALVLYGHPSAKSRTSKREARIALAALAAALSIFLGIEIRTAVGDARLSVRNFYGVLRVIDPDSEPGSVRTRRLVHGVVNHGEQYVDPAQSRQPTTYYSPKSGIGLALLKSGRERPLRVGLIGLGAGVLATYARAGDYWRFYEINPLVVRLAQTEFSFLKECPAKFDVVLGDGRLALERESPQNFDVLILDAFAGDAVPVHLLTREAVALYFRHLRPGGVLALHVSSTYLDLASVASLVARSLSKEIRLVDFPGDPRGHFVQSKWMLASDSAAFFDDPALEQVATRVTPRPGLRLWTDDYSNLFQIIR